VPRDSPLWVNLELKVGKVTALIDTGAQFSCIRSDVAEFLKLREEPFVVTSCCVTCLLADGQRCEVTEAAKLHVKLLSFSWEHELKVLGGGPFPAILGLDILDCTKMVADVASSKFSYGFAPSSFGTFSVPNWDGEVEPYIQNLREEASNMATVSEVWPGGVTSSSIMADFPALFSPNLGTANSTPYEV